MMRNIILILVIIGYNIIHLVLSIVAFVRKSYDMIILMSVIISIIIIFGYNYTHYEIEEGCCISKI